MALNYEIFQHSYIGFNGTSTLFYGEKDAILIDACFTLSDAHRLAAGLLETRKNISHIYISHFHPDHVSDLAPFLLATKYTPGFVRTKPLSIVGPAGLKKFLDRLSIIYGKWMKSTDYLLNIYQLAPDR